MFTQGTNSERTLVQSKPEKLRLKAQDNIEASSEYGRGLESAGG